MKALLWVCRTLILVVGVILLLPAPGKTSEGCDCGYGTAVWVNYSVRDAWDPEDWCERRRIDGNQYAEGEGPHYSAAISNAVANAVAIIESDPLRQACTGPFDVTYGPVWCLPCE